MPRSTRRTKVRVGVTSRHQEASKPNCVLLPDALTRPKKKARFGFGFFADSCMFIWGSLLIGNVKCRNRRSFVMSNFKSEVISRRKALSLLGLATLSLTVPATVLTVSDANAQAQQPAPVAPMTGTERRQERRTGRGNRRTGGRAARG